MNISFLRKTSSYISILFVSSRILLRTNVFPTPAAPHKNIFLPFSNRDLISFISRSWSEIRSTFFCLYIVTKAFMSNDNEDADLATQALDIIMENNTLQTRVIDPLKRKLFPYLMCITVFNFTLFIMVAYLVNRLSAIL